MMNDFSLRLGRRSMLKGAGALALAATAGQARAATPRKGGTLRIGVSGASSSDSLDPATWPDIATYVVAGQLFNTLIELDETLGLRPSLAESWESRNGAREWVLRIRSGVTFHNGKKLTVSDVIYSINHHRGDKSQSIVKPYVDPILDLKETAPGELTITLSGGNADFPYILTDVHLSILPEGVPVTKGIGTGSYVLDSFQPGVRAQAHRNPQYWDTTRGHVDSVETIFLNDTTSRVAALLSGNVDIVDAVEPRLYHRVAASPGVDVFRSPDALIYTFPGLATLAPFTNLDARRAVKYAIDREQIVQAILAGTGSVANDQPIVPANRYFAHDLKPLPYDPDRAGFYWKRAGFAGPLPLSVSDTGFTGSVDAAQLYQQTAARAGIPLTVDQEPSDGYWDNVWLKKQFVASNWSTRPTADSILSLVYLSKADWNETKWGSSQLDQIILAARGEPNEDKRRQLYHDAQVLIAQQDSVVIPVRADALDGVRKTVRGFTIVPGWSLSGGRVAEKVWLEA